MTIRIRVISNQALASYKQMVTANTQLATSTKATSLSVSGATKMMGNAYASMAAKATAATSSVVGGLSKSANAANKFASGGLTNLHKATARFGNTLGSVFNTKTASQIQWVGRQLTYNFTLPIMAAGTAATKWALATEAGMTRLGKVYGDNSAVFQKLSKTELPALQRAFEALSNFFGVAQSDVANIGADWAQAGVSGLALAKSVKLTLETMVLGEMDAKSATEALIATQAQYGLSISQLSTVMDILNMAENESAASMPDLLDAFQRSAGSARNAGVDVEHLAAMVSSLVPAAGSAENAGNALKTIFSRLLSPTKEAAEVMGLMGINTKDAGWQSMTATQRLEKMATTFHGLDDAQKAVVSSVIASRWQINKFDVLMEDMNNTGGRYHKTLDAVSDQSKNYAQRVKELNMVLSSNPQKIKQVWTILQNALIDVIIPMIPHIVSLGQTIAGWAKAFGNLNPVMQKFIVWTLAGVAAVGPLTRVIGAFGHLVNIILSPVILLGKAIFTLGRIAAATANLMLAVFKPIFGLLAGITSAVRLAISALFSGISLVLGKLVPLIAQGAGLAVKAMVTVFAGAGKLIWAAMSAVGPAIVAVWQATWAAVIAIGKAFQAAWIVISSAVTAAWAAANRAMVVISTLFTRAWYTVMASMGSIMPAIGTAMTRIWAAIHVAMATISVTFTKFLYTTWLALERAFVVVTVAIKTAWQTMLVTMWILQQTFATMSFSSLATFGKGFLTLFSGLGKFVLRIFTGIPGMIITAVALIYFAFKDQFGKIWQNIQNFFKNFMSGLGGIGQGIATMWSNIVKGVIDVFYMLPQGIQNALKAVVDMVASAAKAVYKLFSYLNPFAHHSPSLVESVKWGMDAIKGSYASVGNVGTVFRKAAADLAVFKNATKGLGSGKFDEARKNVKEARPAAVPAFDNLEKSYNSLIALQNKYNASINAQQAVVDSWTAKLDAANVELEKQQTLLDKAQANLDSLQGKYDAAATKMQNFADAPIKGMQAMSDQIFSNDLAQKKLQLRMMDWKKTHGNIEDVQTQFANLQGQIESLQGKAADLRSKGAGSEITGPLDAQIAGLKDAQKKLGEGGGANAEFDKMAKDLENLQTAGERLNLVNSIKFDPLNRQIDQLANTQKELRFEDITHGIKTQQAVMDGLTPKIAAAKDAVKTHTAAVNAATIARDKLAKREDEEQKKLSALKDQYDQISNAVRDVEQALNDMGAAAADANQKAKAAKDKAGGGMSPGAQNFQDAAGGNWADVGGTAGLGREGGLGDQSFNIDKLTADLAAQTGKLFSMGDIFKPLKDAWNKAWKWIKDNLGGPLGQVWEGIKAVFASFGSLFEGIDLNKAWHTVWDPVQSVLQTAADWITTLWEAVGPTIGDAFRGIWEGMKAAWDAIWPALKSLWDALGPLVQEALPYLKLVLGAAAGAILFIVGAISGALKPALEMIGDVIAGVIDAFTGVIDVVKNLFKIINGVVQLFVGIFTLDWSKAGAGLKKIWEGILGVFSGIGQVFRGLGKIIWGAIKGVGKIIWKGIVGGLKAVWDGVKTFMPKVAEIGKNIIEGIWKGLKNAWNWLWGKISDFFGWIIDGIKNFLGIHSPSTVFADIGKWIIQGLWNGIKGLATLLVDAGKWILNKLWDGIKFIATTFWTWFTDLPSKIWDLIKAAATTIYNLGKWILTHLWDGIKNVATSVWSWFTSLAGWVVDKLKKGAAKLLAAGKWLLDKIWTGIKNVATSVWTWFTSLAGWIIERIKKGFAKLLQVGKDILNKIWTGITTALGAAVNWIATLPGKFLGWIRGAASKIASVGGSILGKIWGGIKTALGLAWDFVSSLPGKFFGWIRSAATKIAEVGGSILGKIWGGIKTALGVAWDFVSSLPGKFLTWVGGIITGLATVGKTILKNIWDGITTAISNAVNWLLDLPAKFIDWVVGLWNSFVAVGTKIASAIGAGVTTGLAAILPGGVPGNTPKPGGSKGGKVVGPGSSTSDSIEYRLSNGEFVITAQKYRQYKDVIEAVHRGTYSNKMLMAQSKNKTSTGSTTFAGSAKPGGPHVVNNTTELHFHGDLSFPGIKTESDAKKLVDQLVFLAGSRGSR